MGFTETFTSRMKETRKKRGYTQNEIIDALEEYRGKTEKELPKTDKAWGLYESGKREPNLELITITCRLLGVSSDYLLGLSDEMQPNAREFQQATGLSESSISALVTMREDEATTGLEIINRLFETGAFYRALAYITRAKTINDNLCNQLSDKVKSGAVAVQLENQLSKNMADMIVPGEIVRDYYTTKATEELMNLIDTIVKGDNNNGIQKQNTSTEDQR